MGDVLKIRIGSLATLDVVRLDNGTKYKLVISERGQIQKRTVAEIWRDDAMKVARFLAGIGEPDPDMGSDEEVTPAD